MDGSETSETARKHPPKPTSPPTPRPDRPWWGRTDVPPRPPLPPHLAGGVDLRVGKRLLWVGGAAYPVRNITRVYTFLLTPRRGDAALRFGKRLAITLALVSFAMLALAVVSGISGRGRDGPFDAGSSNDASLWESGSTVVLAAAAVTLAVFGVELLSVLTAPSHWALAIETSGASTALVTSGSVPHLNELVGHVVHAIENPDTDFEVRVDQLLINPRNYHFGDNVNMYGGSGNTGMAMS